MPTGITPETAKNFLLDAGAVYVNYGDQANQKLLGATKGGASFTVTREIRDMSEAIDGAKGPVKGFRRIIKESAQIKCTLMELSTDNLMRLLPGTAKADHPAVIPTHDSITSTGLIAASDYITNVAIVGTIYGSNEPFIAIITNALGDGNLEIKTADKDEAGVEAQFTAHYDPADLDAVPWEIRNPKRSA